MKRLLLIPLSIWALAGVHAQESVMRRPDPFLELWRYRVFDELRAIRTFTMAESGDGSLWFGTERGVYRYDGYGWQDTHDLGMPREDVLAIVSTPDGAILAGGRGGIRRYADGRWVDEFVYDGLYVRDLAATADGTVWAATTEGLLRLHSNRATLLTDSKRLARIRLPEADIVPVDGPVLNLFDLMVTTDGSIWVGTDAGHILRYDPEPDVWTRFDGPGQAPVSRRPRIAQSSDGSIWIISRGRRAGAVLYDGNNWTPLAVPGTNHQLALTVAEDGSVYIASYAEIKALSPEAAHGPGPPKIGEWKKYGPGLRTFIPRAEISSLVQTRDGALWIVSRHLGVVRFDPGVSGGELINTFPRDGGAGRLTAEEIDGTRWFTLNGDVRKILSGSNRILTVRESEKPLDRCARLISLRDGSLWAIGVHDSTAAVALWNPHRSTWTRVRVPYAGAYFGQIDLSPDGTLWLTSGIHALYLSPSVNEDTASLSISPEGRKALLENPDRLHELATLEPDVDGPLWRLWSSPIKTFVRKAFSTDQDDVWFQAGDGHLFHYDGQTWSKVSVDGFAFGDVWVQPDGTVWVAGNPGILRRLPGSTEWEAFGYDQGLSNHIVRRIQGNSDGAIIAVTSEGIDRWDGRTWSPILPEKLNSEFGLIGEAREMASGAFWLQGWGRQVRFPSESSPPETRIVSGDIGELIEPANTSFAWEGNDTWETTPKAELSFAWRLTEAGRNTGANDSWSTFSRSRGNDLRGLPAGSYTFEVKARDLSFNEDPTPASLSFVVVPPVWKRGWFVGLGFLTLGLIVVQTVRVFQSSQRLRASNSELAVLRESERASKEEYAALLAISRSVQAMKDVGDLRSVVMACYEALRPIMLFHVLQIRRLIRAEGPTCEAHTVISGTYSVESEELAGPLYHEWQRGEIVYRPDLWNDRTVVVDSFDDYLHRLKTGYGDEPVRCLIHVPCDFGLLTLRSSDPDPFTAEHMALIKRVGELISLGSERVGDFEDLARSVDEADLARQEAEAANTAKSVFLANMSHEIRTPMNAILGYTQILEADDTLDEKHRRPIETIGKSGHHLLGLINDVLDISKIEAGRFDLSVADFDLEGMLDGISRMFEMRCEQKDLEWRLETDIETRSVRGDESKLRQVLINVIGNAVKFTENGSVTLDVSEQTESTEKDPDTESDTAVRIRFRVSDTGHGIPSDRLDSIFEPFTQDEAGERIGGTGLGLAITKRHVELMNGSISVDSDVGNGSVFTITLPLGIGSGSVHPAETRDWSRVTGLADGQEIEALIIDDREANLSVLDALLSRVGVTVRSANSGAQGLQRIEEGVPDVVFLDIRMPEMDGPATLRRIRERLGDATPPVIAVTASVFEHQRKEYLEMGFDGLIDKPVQAGEIYEALETHLNAGFTSLETQSDDEEPLAGDFSTVTLPAAEYDAFKQALQEHSITLIRSQVEQWETLDGRAEPFVRLVRERIAEYDVEGIQEAFDKIGRA